jgi:Papain family cysteine protease
MPVSLKYLVNTVTGTVTTLNGCKEDSELVPEEAGSSGEAYAPTRFKKEDLPTMVDMREFMTEVEDQAGAGSCTANAVVGAFEYIMARSGEKVDFSRLFVYYNARDAEKRAAEEAEEKVDPDDEGEESDPADEGEESDPDDDGEESDPEDEGLYGITDSGCTINFALSALKVQGICKEETWDYEVRHCGCEPWLVLYRPHCAPHLTPYPCMITTGRQVKVGARVPKVNTRPSDEAYAAAEALKESPRFSWEAPDELPVDLFAMKHCLAEGYPFVFGLVLYQGWDVAKKHGYVPMPDFATEDIRETHGSHAMLCVGYKESAKVFIVRNSWGTTWGDKVRFLVVHFVVCCLFQGFLGCRSSHYVVSRPGLLLHPL